MKIVVTGASGYLGAAVVKALATMLPDHFVQGVGGPAHGRGPDLTRDASSVAGVDCVVHCAAVVPKNAAGYADVAAGEQNLKMLDTVMSARPRTLLLASSMTVYGEPSLGPVREEDVSGPTSAYGEGKRAGEAMLAEARDRNQIVGMSARLPGLFGPPRKGGLVANVLRAGATGTSLRLPDAPVQWAALHVADAAECLARLTCRLIADAPPAHPAVNIGYAGPMSVPRFLEIVNSLTAAGFRTAVDHPDFEMDLTRARVLDALPKTGFEERLRQMLAPLPPVGAR